MSEWGWLIDRLVVSFAFSFAIDQWLSLLMSLQCTRAGNRGRTKP